MLFKASYKLGKVNRGMHISFNLILHSDEPKKQPSTELVRQFYFNGNEYMNISPNPFVTIDISTRATKRNEGYNPNRSVNLNGYSLFLLTTALKRLLNNFRTIKELYYYDDGELIVDKELSKKCIEVVSAGDKKIRVQPVVVPPDEPEAIGSASYEGAVFIINSFDSYQYLTITELEYLVYVLSSIRMNEMSMLLMNTVKLHKTEIIEQLDKPIEEEVEIHDEAHETSVFVTQPQSMLPKI